jgi:integrase
VVAPTAPTDGEDGLAASKQESVIGPSPRREEHAQVLVQANGAREQTNAAWREVEVLLAKLKEPYALLAMIMYGCGLRLSETANLRIQNFNLKPLQSPLDLSFEAGT